jgi:hypothetical protein
LLRFTPPDFSRVDEDDDDIERHLAVLQADFNCLASILSSVNEAAAYLKRIYLEVSTCPTINPSPMELFVAPGTPSAKVSKMDKTIHRFACAQIAKCLLRMGQFFPLLPEDSVDISASLDVIDEDDYYHYDEIAQYAEPSSHRDTTSSMNMSFNRPRHNYGQNGTQNLDDRRNSTLTSRYISSLQLVELFTATERRIIRILESTNNSRMYPVGITDIYARRPSQQERFWLRDFILSMASVYLGMGVLRMFNDGSLKVVATIFSHVLQ